MNKLVLILALTGFLGTGTTAAFACEGGKCKMEHTDKAKKSKKGKKTTNASESCHMASTKADKSKTAACCMKKESAKTETSKETKDVKTHQ